VVPSDAKEPLLRTQTGLPFENRTTHWLVQLHVKNKAAFQLAGTTHVVNIKQKTKKTYADLLGIKILQLKKPAAGRLKLERVVEPMMMPRGQRVSIPLQRRGGNGYKSGTGSMSGPGTGYGSGTGSGTGKNTGSSQGSQTGRRLQRQ
jgi:hypothetical protein